jgi:lipid II:glycine glycyltransferase (peptidoglycan interpeptide bridge formation enzyme)
VQELNPLTDRRWPGFVSQHPDASIFHTQEWLKAISKTYGYEPVAFTTSRGEELSNALVFCRIRSWLTGRRLVSLPFSDHCQPLASGSDFAEILRYLKSQRRSKQQKYIELRPVSINGFGDAESDLVKSESFSFQRIDLRPEVKAIYSGFHESCIRRKIKRAERETLVYESGRSEELLKKFRHLLLLTRRRHKLPPQPPAWFQNIVDCLGDMVTIHVASKDTIPVASIVTLSYKMTLVYKYGCSDGQFSNMGGTPLLFWRAIQQAKVAGMEQFDLGRSDHDEPGLIAFKEHLGATSSELNYYRDPARPIKEVSMKSPTSASSLVREALVRLPDSLLAGVGQLLYRHIG